MRFIGILYGRGSEVCMSVCERRGSVELKESRYGWVI